MKKLLAILNIVATIPLASLAIGIFLVGYVVKPIDDSGTVGSIGGADGPTSIFIANEPGAYAPLVCAAVRIFACMQRHCILEGQDTERSVAAYRR